MTELVSVIAAAVVALAVVALALLTFKERTGRVEHRADVLVARRVLVQLADGSAVAGLLTRQPTGFLVIENARLHENGAEVPVDGAAWVPAEQVRWIQVGGEG